MERTLQEDRRYFSRIGWGFSAMLLSAMLLQILLGLLSLFAPDFSQSPWYVWILGSIPLYFVGGPLCLLVVSVGLPRVYIRDHKLGFGTLCVCFAICYAILYIGNFLGSSVNSLIGLLRGGTVENPVDALLAGQNLWLTTLFVVLIGPLAEELLCRKLIIDRLAPYGDKTAIFVSALIFALLHGNFQQCFYAFGVGLVLGYVYIRCGRLRYTIGLHILLNFSGSVLPSLVLENTDLSALASIDPGTLDPQTILPLLPQLLTLLGYGLLSLALVVLGIIFFFVFRKRIRLYPGEFSLCGRRFKAVVLNPGMLVFFLVCAGLFTMNLF